ncbi:MAG: OmpA family protein, partial [Bacteroidales bacterium]|nr:OmpA family protein [Bacteroidales bacterium]
LGYNASGTASFYERYVALTASPAVNAQENGNRDEYGKVVRGPYETNRFGDNWFIGAGGGINVFLNDGYKTNIGPSLDVSLGKWFTPAVGMRIGYSGLNTNYWADDPSVLGRTLDKEENMYQQKFGYMYIHGDFLWNMSDALGGYKETRFWDLVPYLHAGYFRAYSLDGASYVNNEIAAGAGLLHNLRLSNRLDLIVDMKATLVNGRVDGSAGVAFLPSITMGFAVDMGWPDFVRTSTVIGALEAATVDQIAALEAAAVALELANATLEKENIDLQNANGKLNDQVNALKKNKGGIDPAEFYKGMSPVAVYFNIGKATLSTDEMQHLDYIARNIVAKAGKLDKVYITVMGSADSNTGTAKINQKLSEARGKYIADMLTSKYGIAKDRLVIKSEVVKAKADPELERAVKITF